MGLWRGGIYMHQLGVLNAYEYQKVTIDGTVMIDSVYGRNSQIEFELGNIHLIQPDNRLLVGKFRVSGYGTKMACRGDVVRVTGKLYPYRGADQARMSYAQLQIMRSGSSWLNNLTRRFAAGMQNALPEPVASFAMGLLIGQRNTLPQTVTTQLTMVGLVHIIAVSGYNLTIIVRGVGRLKLGSKYQKLITSLILIGGFVLITGFSASIVRAAIVSSLSLWAWFYGRRLKPHVLIAFAAALTGLFNPFYVWGDMSWYLSFLAFFGVLIISPIITARLFRHRPKLLTQVVIETLSAEIMTLPLILMSFNQLSLIALVANALVVPLVPLAMLLSAVAGAAGALIPQFAGWLAFPARLLLTYMLDIVHLMASIPSVLVRRSITAVYMVAVYGLIVIVLFVAHHKLPKTRKLISEEITP